MLQTTQCPRPEPTSSFWRGRLVPSRGSRPINGINVGKFYLGEKGRGHIHQGRTIHWVAYSLWNTSGFEWHKYWPSCQNEGWWLEKGCVKHSAFSVSEIRYHPVPFYWRFHHQRYIYFCWSINIILWMMTPQFIIETDLFFTKKIFINQAWCKVKGK